MVGGHFVVLWGKVIDICISEHSKELQKSMTVKLVTGYEFINGI